MIERYISGEITPGDQQALARMLQQEEYREELEWLLREAFMENTFGREEDEARTTRFLAGLRDRMSPTEIRELPLATDIPGAPSRRRVYYIARIAAAAILLFVLVGLYLLLSKKDTPGNLSGTERFKNDVQPGHYGAFLTSSKGKRIELDSVQDGSLLAEGNVQLVKKNDELTYEGDAGGLLYNTVSTPRGRQWRLTLSDGTRVWLNAQSSIRYPVSFSGDERRVAITGEACFEVAGSSGRPFKVTVNGAEISVLGTVFDVNAYTDEEALLATLLQGSVRVSAGASATVLRPGQQMAVWPNGKTSLEASVDTAAVTGWRRDQFVFNDAPTGVVVRQLARWYDVDVRYEGNVNQYFIGTISRNEPLSKVLRLLELTGGVHFKIEGKTITVMK